MIINRVRIDGQVFLLDPAQDVEQLKAQIVAASREGSAFVDFVTVGRAAISVLVTPYETARFETIERSDEEVAAWEVDPPSFDLADY